MLYCHRQVFVTAGELWRQPNDHPSSGEPFHRPKSGVLAASLPQFQKSAQNMSETRVESNGIVPRLLAEWHCFSRVPKHRKRLPPE